MNQTLAILIDGYRELNHKRLFWVALALSGLFVLAFAAIGINDRGITFLWYDFPVGGPIAMFTTSFINEETFYKFIFVNFGLSLWLAWIATILALVSTASIIPDFVQGGAVELGLSKPISRARLFLTKFAAGLLFAGLQVLVFTAACFLVIGLRAGAWEPGLFIAVPLVTLFFSYLYCISALVGLVTRSSITALLVTLLCWFFFFMLNSADVITLQISEQMRRDVERKSVEVARSEEAAAAAVARRRESAESENGASESAGSESAVAAAEGAQESQETAEVAIDPKQFTPEELASVDPLLADAQKGLASSRRDLREAETWQKRFYFVKTLLPKTSETVSLTERWIMSAAELKSLEEIGQEQEDRQRERRRGRNAERAEQRNDRDVAGVEVERILRGRSVWWVIGSSIVFEAIVLGIACVIFVRRDF